METTVRALRESDHEAWHRLWDGYCAFYKTTMPAEVTANTWARMIDEGDSIYLGFVAERDGEVIGIANCIVHHTTWAIAPRCYLNDLFVDPLKRGSGAGKALIDHLRQVGKEQSWDKIHWLTAETNATARRLYDQFSPASGFIQYAITPEEKR